MLKVLFVSGITSLFVMSCDVRTKDKIDNNLSSDQKKTETVAPPTTVQMIDTIFDFSKITEGEIVEFSYRFKNTGTNPLIVTNVSASCGCTIPEKPEAPIKPGETGFIKVKFNSQGRPGETHKTVTVLSNAAPVFPELLLKGEVLPKAKT